jgi:hypothetical protein
MFAAGVTPTPDLKAPTTAEAEAVEGPGSSTSARCENWAG